MIFVTVGGEGYVITGLYTNRSCVTLAYGCECCPSGWLLLDVS